MSKSEESNNVGLTPVKAEPELVTLSPAVIPPNPFRFKVLFVGATGVGKTSAQMSLVERESNSKSQEIKETLKRLGSGKATERIQETPPIPIKINDKDVVIFVFVDSPGYSDYMHMETSMEMTMDYMEGLHKKGSSHTVDAIVYVLEPAKITQVDVVYMKLLSENSILVPVIGKGDTMDPDQKAAWQLELFNVLNSHKIPFYQLDDEKIFTIMGSESGKIRRYSGDQEKDVFDSVHSDMLEFRDSMFSQYWDIKSQKKTFRQKWKNSQVWTNILIQNTKVKAETSAYFCKYIFVIVFILWIGFLIGKQMNTTYKISQFR